MSRTLWTLLWQESKIIQCIDVTDRWVWFVLGHVFADKNSKKAKTLAGVFIK